MSDAVISVILTQMATILDELIRKEVRLISGVEKEFNKLKSELDSIKAVLRDAEKRQVKEAAVKIWLEKLKDLSYDAEDVLSEWITAMQKAEMDGLEKNSPTQKVFSFFTFPCAGFNRVTLRRDIALKIKRINEGLDIIASEKDKYNFNLSTGNESLDRHKSTSFIVLSEVQGRDADKDAVIRKILSEKNGNKGLNVVSIVGLGGIGKTTLAQVVYNEIRGFEMRIWVCVSEPFDEVRVAKAILEVVEGSAPCLFELETAARKIRNYVLDKKFLLVLDDVWTEDFRKWEQLINSLRVGASGSTILLTTRSERVAKVMGSSYEHRLGQLSESDSWTLFKKIAFFERSEEECEKIEEVGKKIAEKCKGLPLTIKTIGGLMRFKTLFKKDWEDVLNSEFWELEESEGLFPPLMLSYYDLPSTIQQCFLFCAFFPKDHEIEANILIQLWMALGYLNSTEKVEMEAIGQKYLQNLAMRSFFQDLKRDKDGMRILSFKIHDMVHDFAQFITKNECTVIEVNNDLGRKMESPHKKPRHLTLVRAEDTHLPDIKNVEKLFTFWVQSFYDCPPIRSQLDRIEPDLLRRLASLRALDLSRNRIDELPKDIGNLIKLKYLNLSHNPLRELPENLCDLFNLQTLKLSACYHLRKLPRRIGKLVNLRHLEIDETDSLKTLPKGIGNLGSLQTLSKFIVVRGDELEELKNLDSLQGCLKIEGLGNVADANEARKAELWKKKHLSDLQMDFSSSTQNGSQYEVIEALELHENLQSLEISSYRGNKLPNWIMKLRNLQNLLLQDCQNCTNLPPLGRLISLMTLHIEGMNGIKSLGLDFLGVDPNDRDTMNGFSKLKKLKISKMESWGEWEFVNDENFKIMPRLKCLKISHCSKLKMLPIRLLKTAPMGKLRIDNCPLLQRRYNKETGEDWNEISHIPKVRT